MLKVERLYDEYLESSGYRTAELLDEILLEFCMQIYGETGSRYWYFFRKDRSAFGQVSLPETEGLRAVVNHGERRLGVVVALSETYLATVAARALVSDPNAAEYGYKLEIHCVVLPKERDGEILLEGRAYDTLLALFHTPPRKVWMVGRGEVENERANRYVADPHSLKQAIVSNVSYHVERMTSCEPDRLTEVDAATITGLVDAFQGLMFFAEDRKEWSRWADSVRPAWEAFRRRHPNRAVLLRVMKDELADMTPDDLRPSRSFASVNDPSLIRGEVLQ